MSRVEKVAAFTGFILGGIVLLPFLGWCLLIEAGSFSRWPILLAALCLLFLNFLCFRVAFDKPPRFQHKIVWPLLGLALLTNLFFTLLATASLLFTYYCCSMGLRRLLPERLKLHGLVVLPLMLSLLFPFMNMLYFRGIYPGLTSQRHMMQNWFYNVNEQGFRGWPVDKQKKSQKRILFLGDSTTFGFPYRAKEGYALLVERELQASMALEVINGGTIGHDVVHMHERLDYWLSFSPDLVVILPGFHWNKTISHLEHLEGQAAEPVFGFRPHFWPPMIPEMVAMGFAFQAELIFGKNYKGASDIAAFEKHLNGVLIRLKAQNIPVLVLEYPTSDLKVSDIVKKSAFTHQAVYVPLYQKLKGKIATANNDGVHPDREGHRQIAELLLPLIKQALASP